MATSTFPIIGVPDEQDGFMDALMGRTPQRTFKTLRVGPSLEEHARRLLAMKGSCINLVVDESIRDDKYYLELE